MFNEREALVKYLPPLIPPSASSTATGEVLREDHQTESGHPFASDTRPPPRWPPTQWRPLPPRVLVLFLVVDRAPGESKSPATRSSTRSTREALVKYLLNSTFSEYGGYRG